MGEPARKLDWYAKTASGRAAPRTEVHASVNLSSEHNFWAGLSMNISEGGVFVATHHVIAVGTHLHLKMTLPFEAADIETTAVVRWTRTYNVDSDVPPGLGLQFVDMDHMALAKIRNFVKTTRDPLFYDDD